MYTALCSSLVRSRHAVAPVLVVTILLLAAASPASALTWTNVSCASAAECPQIGTPTGPCNCGLYKDAPGVATTARIESAFVFVGSAVTHGAADETAAWRAPLAAPLANQATLEVRGAVNDNSDLKVVLYDSTVAVSYLTCSTQGLNVIALLDWSDVQDNSLFYQRTAAIAANKLVQGICLIVTDNPDTVAPASARSSAIVDYIALIDAGAVKTFVEDFALTN